MVFLSGGWLLPPVRMSWDGRAQDWEQPRSGEGSSFPQARSRTTDAAQAPAPIPDPRALCKAAQSMPGHRRDFHISAHLHLYPWSLASQFQSKRIQSAPCTQSLAPLFPIAETPIATPQTICRTQCLGSILCF